MGKRIRRILIRIYSYWINYLHWRSFVLLRFHIFARWFGAAAVLRMLGAEVGRDATIAPDIRIQNARRGRCFNLHIGRHVYIGPRCLFELASEITVDDDVALSADVSIITHADVGNRPLKERFPRKEGPVIIRKGAWLGVKTTVLHGVDIGEYAVIGTMSLVNKDVPANSLCYGIPCRVVKQFDGPPIGRRADSSQSQD